MDNYTSFANSKTGTIFIPDISGFTHFINHTEISHSQHIITELLELIIKETGDLFLLSEIEGDAILFYKFIDKPDFDKITALCINIFKKFHQHLKYYDRDRVCHCGACTSTDSLSLKFIVHFGEFSIYQVGGYSKLLGKDVILAHRLLKNGIGQNEYLLFSDDFIKASCLPDIKIFDMMVMREIMEGLEPTVFYYRILSDLKSEITEPPSRNIVNLPDIKAKSAIDIKYGYQELILALTEPDKRLKWMRNLKKITLKEHKINRVSTSHECLIGGNQIEIKIEQLEDDEKDVKLIERAHMKSPNIDFIILYHLEKTGRNQTLISIGNHFYPSPIWYIRLIIVPIFSLILKMENRLNMKRLKKYMEAVHHVV